ncbi:MAG: GNAT family N-acetyltransferase, partial [Aeriscardovia sp.]|nr:GNAT family N-acetyltransferase [Aeriscardovia sp.]
MKRSDLDWAHDLDCRLFSDAAWEKEDMQEAFLPGRRFFVEEGKKLEGWAGMDASGAFAHILSIDVEPSFQGKGLGSSLLSSLLSSAKGMGKKKCILEVSCDNEKALESSAKGETDFFCRRAREIGAELDIVVLH